MQGTLRGLLAACLAATLTACAVSETRSPPPLRPSLPGGTRIEMPDVLGVPVAMLAPELPAGAIADGERARFDIDFTIDLRGAVTASGIASTTRPDLGDAMLAQHRQWIYAVATRDSPCRVRRFRGLQSIEVQRRDGKLVASGDPAQVIEILSRSDIPRVDRQTQAMPENYRQVMKSIAYPRSALLEGVEARFALLVVFSTDGTVKDAFPVNAAYDRYGFARNAIQAVRRLKVDPPPARELTVCQPMDFLIR